MFKPQKISPKLSQLWRLFSLKFYSTFGPRQTLIIPDLFLEWLGIEYRQLKYILKGKGIHVMALSAILSASKEDSELVVAKELCQKLAVYPALVELEECQPIDDPAFHNSLSKWSEMLCSNIHILVSRLNQIRPLGVVVVQGYEPTNAALRAAALLSGTPCLAIENSSRPDKVIWDNIASYACIDNLAKNYYFKYKSFVSDSEALAYGNLFTSSLFLKKSNEHQSGASATAQVAALPRSGYVLFLCQVYTDAATINCLCDWPSPLSLLEGVIDWCIQMKMGLVVKLHPKEIEGRNTVTLKRYDRLTLRKINQSPAIKAKLNYLESFVDCDNLLNTYELIRSASLVVTLSSQAGLEAAIFGKPVVVGGRSSYSGLGFTYDAPSPALLEKQLSLALKNTSSDLSLEASRFAYIYFEKYCINKTEQALADLCVATLSCPS